MVSTRRLADDGSEPSKGDLLHLDIDLRIGVETWVDYWLAKRTRTARAAEILRTVYGKGYTDALTEPCRGQLCRDHGLRVPERGAEG
jgi:hypothetical protein